MRLFASILVSLALLHSSISLAVNPTTSDHLQSLHLEWLDKSVAPGQNFFKFSNGNWQKNNPIPADYARWGTFYALQQQNLMLIHQMLETIANEKTYTSSNMQKIGDFYASGMDITTINRLGIKPLQTELTRISQMKTHADLQKTITHLQLIGVDALFGFTQMQDFKDSTQVIGVASQGGLGLPDRDYYLKKEPKFQQIRETYLRHVANMFVLLGDQPNIAAQEAKTIMRIETTLAKASMSRIEQRDPHAIYHMMDLTQLQNTTPNFAWSTYFTDLGHPDIKSVNLAMPEFFKSLDAQLKTISIEDWKTYLRWHLIDAFAPYLSQAFVDENFRMTQALTGTQQLLPRWQRVVNAEDGALGFAVGKLYVEKTFPPSAKQQVEAIMDNIKKALKNDLETLSWMTPETRKAALIKLDKMVGRIGYPDKWRDYSSLKIDRGPYVLNIMRANEFLNHYELNKIGKPVDKSEWDMTPQTVNAYYDPSMNMLTIPAGILQPPFFDEKAPAALNYGAIGSIIGHEMTHGFDDEGAQFDENGNLKNWWTPTDLKKFQAATQCIANQFSKYTVDGSMHVQGKLVTGEATADLGGLILAYRAFHASNAYQHAKTVDGLTPDQQFFLGAAHVEAANIRPSEARRLVIIDPHPPAMYRVNGTIANIPQFQEAFGVTAGSPMINKDRCIIW